MKNSHYKSTNKKFNINNLFTAFEESDKCLQKQSSRQIQINQI